ncbi:MAG TPA: sugar transferase [Terriglobales bacterium]|nr:sugar transferase [Terriglobales bacterium]
MSLELSQPTISQGRNRQNEAVTVAKLVKRTVDFIGSFFLIICLSPVFLIASAMVFFADGRPIIYRRRVVGPSGEFDAFKFRTMRPDADLMLKNDPTLREAFSQNYKLKLDPRITRVGAFLRKYSLDELPQLFNVLAGRMSLVGPRMITAPELEKYGEYQQLLLTVKPGLTGYWQVHGRQEVSYRERVSMDVEYIRKWSLSRDMQLLLLTPMRVIRGKGAY